MLSDYCARATSLLDGFSDAVALCTMLHMPIADHLDVLRLGACAVDEWRRAHPSERLHLAGADLGGMVFDGFNLSRAVFDGADLRGCSFRGTDLSECWMRRVDLRCADLTRAVLHRANLAGADVRDANLSSAQMYRCVLRDASVNDGTSFDGAHVAKVVWPDAVAQRSGRMTIGWGPGRSRA